MLLMKEELHAQNYPSRTTKNIQNMAYNMIIILLSNWNILHVTKYLRYKTSFNAKQVDIKNKAEKALSSELIKFSLNFTVVVFFRQVCKKKDAKQFHLKNKSSEIIHFEPNGQAQIN